MNIYNIYYTYIQSCYALLFRKSPIPLHHYQANGDIYILYDSSSVYNVANWIAITTAITIPTTRGNNNSKSEKHPIFLCISVGCLNMYISIYICVHNKHPWTITSRCVTIWSLSFVNASISGASATTLEFGGQLGLLYWIIGIDMSLYLRCTSGPAIGHNHLLSGRRGYRWKSHHFVLRYPSDGGGMSRSFFLIFIHPFHRFP